MFGQQQVKYLGYCIDAMRIHPKVHAISEARSSKEKRPSQRLIIYIIEDPFTLTYSIDGGGGGGGPRPNSGCGPKFAAEHDDGGSGGGPPPNSGCGPKFAAERDGGGGTENPE